MARIIRSAKQFANSFAGLTVQCVCGCRFTIEESDTITRKYMWGNPMLTPFTPCPECGNDVGIFQDSKRDQNLPRWEDF